MRLLTVTHFYETHGGGIERVAGELNRQLSVLGHATSWAAAAGDAPPARETAEAIPLRCINAVERVTGLPMPIPTTAALRRLRRAVRESDAVIIHDALYVTSIAAMRAAKRAGKPVLLIQHIAGIPFRSAFLRGAMRIANAMVTRRMLQAADQVVFISETVAGQFGDVRYARPPLVIFNGVDISIFRPAESGEKDELRTRLGFLPDRPVVLFVGRFVEKKGLSILRELAARRPDFDFVLAGQGPIDPLAWDLPNVGVRSGLAGERLAALYRASDAFVLPSVGEGFPLVIQEALATQLPVVCGSESMVADSVAAPLLSGVPVSLSEPAETAASFAEALDTALAGEPEPQRRALAEARYAWPAAAARYHAVLTSLACRSADRSRQEL